MKSGQQATYLRNFLLISLSLVLIAMAGGFYYVQDQLRTLSNNPVNSGTTVNMSSEQLIQLQTAVSSHKEVTKKANSLIASSQDYQNQVMNDLNRYAAESGVGITSYKSADPKTTDLSGIAGLAPKFMSITLSNPVSYPGLIKFLRSIETNTPKMQLTGIGVSRTGRSNGAVNVDDLTIEVFTQ